MKVDKLLLIGYDTKRKMWRVRDGMDLHTVTDGMLMNVLDGYRQRIETANGGETFIGRARKLWDELGHVEIVGIRQGEGLVIRDKRTGEMWGRHGPIKES